MVKNDDFDLPLSQNDCQLNPTCESGSPVFFPASLGSTCVQAHGERGFCDGRASVASCVECIMPRNCKTSDNECQFATCIAGKCGFGNVGADFLLSSSSQVMGDCKKVLNSRFNFK